MFILQNTTSLFVHLRSQIDITSSPRSGSHTMKDFHWESTSPHDATYALKGLSNRQLGFWVSRDLTGKGNDRGGSVQQIPLNMYYIQKRF